MPNADCVFCQIAKHKIGKIKYENKDFAVFDDLNPKAKFHFLIIPKKHITNFDELNEDKLLLGLLKTVKETVLKYNFNNGYRLILNNKAGGGQVINHLHLHLLVGLDEQNKMKFN